MARRASYRHAVEWIAFNDEPELSPYDMIDLISIALVSALFGRSKEEVTRDVARYREGL